MWMRRLCFGCWILNLFRHFTEISLCRFLQAQVINELQQPNLRTDCVIIGQEIPLKCIYFGLVILNCHTQIYKPEGRGYDSRWCHWNLSLTLSFRSHCGPGVDSASNWNEYQECPGGKGGRCVGLTTLPLLCADCHEIWEPQPPGYSQGLFRPVMGLLYLCFCHAEILELIVLLPHYSSYCSIKIEALIVS